MKVCYLNSGNLFGGIETLLVTLARYRGECPEMEPEFGVCFEGKYSRALRQEGVVVHNYGAARMSRPWQVWSARRMIAAQLRQSRPDVVVAHGSWSLAVLGPEVRKAGIPLVYWTHDRVASPMPWQEKWAKLTPPDLVIANSHYTAAGQDDLYPGIPRQVIYCALSPPLRRYEAEEIAEFRQRQNTPKDVPVILQVSRLDEHKGHRIHLQALGRLRDLPWICWIVAGPQRPAEKVFLEELKQQAKDLGIADRVRFLGWQEDVEIVFEAADVFCQPNTGAEPFGLTFVEALWRGKPVVSSAMAGALEVVSADCGILCPPGDASALAESLGRLVGEPELRGRLGAAGPARAQGLCDPAARLREVELCLRKLTGIA